MKRNALHIMFRLVTLVLAVFILASCADLVKPKTMFYGTIKNITEWLLYVPNPADQAEVHELSPGVYFSTSLEGSRVYHFQANLPDGTVYASFDARVNNISRDATVNDVKVDWTWIIGGPFMACVTPVGGGDLSAVSVTVENFTCLDPILTRPQVQMFKDQIVMNRAMQRFDRTSVPTEGRLFPGHEHNRNIYEGRSNVIVDTLEVK